MEVRETRKEDIAMNEIAKNSELYRNLIVDYDTENKLLRFNTCYDLIEKATYKEVLFVISCIKECEAAEELDNSVSDTIKPLITAMKTVFGSKIGRRQSYLLDLLEEARERKRQQK